MLPAVLGLLGVAGSSVAAASALRALNIPMLLLTILFLGRAWWLQLGHHWKGVWGRRAGWVLTGSTIFAVTAWGLRLTGVLGPPMF